MPQAMILGQVMKVPHRGDGGAPDMIAAALSQYVCDSRTLTGGVHCICCSEIGFRFAANRFKIESLFIFMVVRNNEVVRAKNPGTNRLKRKTPNLTCDQIERYEQILADQKSTAVARG